MARLASGTSANPSWRRRPQRAQTSLGATAVGRTGSSDVVALRIGDLFGMTVLVVYASRHGATEGIAARVAMRLADSGATVDLRHVDDVQNLDAYDAMVVGAPVY